MTLRALLVLDRSKRLGGPSRHPLLRSQQATTPHTPSSPRQGRQHHFLNEMDAFFHGVIVELFARTVGLDLSDVDMLVVNVSTLHLVLPIASRIVRTACARGIPVYNLSGMGCGAMLVARNLARNALRARSSLALVVSVECIMPKWYAGRNGTMMLCHYLLR